MDYKKLRDMVSHRVTFEFDSGAKVVGYIASCAPASGPVLLLVLSKVQILDGAKNVLAKYDEYPLVPNNYSRNYGPTGADRRQTLGVNYSYDLPKPGRAGKHRRELHSHVHQ